MAGNGGSRAPPPHPQPHPCPGRAGLRSSLHVHVALPAPQEQAPHTTSLRKPPTRAALQPVMLTRQDGTASAERRVNRTLVRPSYSTARRQRKRIENSCPNKISSVKFTDALLTIAKRRIDSPNVCQRRSGCAGCGKSTPWNGTQPRRRGRTDRS